MNEILLLCLAASSILTIPLLVFAALEHRMRADEIKTLYKLNDLKWEVLHVAEKVALNEAPMDDLRDALATFRRKTDCVLLEINSSDTKKP